MDGKNYLEKSHSYKDKDLKKCKYLRKYSEQKCTFLKTFINYNKNK